MRKHRHLPHTTKRKPRNASTFAAYGRALAMTLRIVLMPGRVHGCQFVAALPRSMGGSHIEISRLTVRQWRLVPAKKRRERSTRRIRSARRVETSIPSSMPVASTRMLTHDEMTTAV